MHIYIYEGSYTQIDRYDLGPRKPHNRHLPHSGKQHILDAEFRLEVLDLQWSHARTEMEKLGPEP